jgi:hypothetical protein
MAGLLGYRIKICFVWTAFPTKSDEAQIIPKKIVERETTFSFPSTAGLSPEVLPPYRG